METLNEERLFDSLKSATLTLKNAGLPYNCHQNLIEELAEEPDTTKTINWNKVGPNLLGALKDAVWDVENNACGESLDQMRKAIAKTS